MMPSRWRHSGNWCDRGVQIHEPAISAQLLSSCAADMQRTPGASCRLPGAEYLRIRGTA